MTTALAIVNEVMDFSLSVCFVLNAIDDFHKLFIDEVKVSKPFFNAAEKSIIIIKFDVENNTVGTTDCRNSI